MSSAAMVFPGLRPQDRNSVIGAMRMKRDALPDLIIKQVCKLYGVDQSSVFLKTRRKKILEPRHICMHILSKHAHYTLKVIGSQIFKKFDHTTVLHAKNRIQNMIDTEEEMRTNIQFLVESVGL